MKPVSLIKTSLNETYSKVHISKICLTYFLFRMVWNRDMLYHCCFSILFLKYVIKKVQENQEWQPEWETSAMRLCWWC